MDVMDMMGRIYVMDAIGNNEQCSIIVWISG